MDCCNPFDQVTDDEGQHPQLQGSLPRKGATELQSADPKPIDSEGTHQGSDDAHEGIAFGMAPFVLEIAGNTGDQ